MRISHLFYSLLIVKCTLLLNAISYTLQVEKINWIIFKRLKFRLVFTDKNQSTEIIEEPVATSWYIFNSRYEKFKDSSSEYKLAFNTTINGVNEPIHNLEYKKEESEPAFFNSITNHRYCQYASQYSYKIPEAGWSEKTYLVAIDFNCNNLPRISLESIRNKISFKYDDIATNNEIDDSFINDDSINENTEDGENIPEKPNIDIPGKLNDQKKDETRKRK